MGVLTYKYGLLDPIDWDRDCHEQLFLMNSLWNALVEIEHGQRERYRSIVNADTEIMPLQQRIDAITAERDGLIAQRNKRRQQARARLDLSEISARLKELSAERKALAAERREIAARIRERIKPLAERLHAERVEAVKQARNASGLWWGNYNAICGDYETARSRAMRDGTELRFHRFTGEGRFTVQIVGGATVEEILSGTKQVAIDLTPQPVPGKNSIPRPGKKRPRLKLAIYTRDRQARTLAFPLIYDRPLPEAARVQEVTVTRRQIATHWRHEVVFTLRVADPAPVNSSEKKCAVNVGFRKIDDALRIATIIDQSGIRHVELSENWMTAMDDVDEIQSARKKSLNEICTKMREAWSARPLPAPDFDERLSNLVHSDKRGAGSLAAVVIAWREHAMWWPEMLYYAEAWRLYDKKQFEIEANKRDHLNAARRERYRLLARSLAQNYGEIRLGKIELRRLAEIQSRDGTENELHKLARKNRTRAALYNLQREILWQAKKSGALVKAIDGPFTATCHACGERCAVAEPLMHKCEHCAVTWDQDDNAVRNIFAADRERFGDGGNGRQRSHDKNQGVSGDPGGNGSDSSARREGFAQSSLQGPEISPDL